MKSCKAVWWLFPIVTNTGLFVRCHRKVKRDRTSLSLFEFMSCFSIFFCLFCPRWEFQLSQFLSESHKTKSFRVYPKAPERKWAFPSVGRAACLCLHYIPAAKESQGGTVPRTVKQISSESTKKRLKSKWTLGWLSSLRYWTLTCRFKSLIVIVGVEVSEVCVGVGLPGELWVEVLVPFLQNQIVFVEGLRNKMGEQRGVSADPLAARG